jgi:hypothetical protein
MTLTPALSVVLIDPVKKEISYQVIQNDKGLDGFYKAMDCHLVDIVTLTTLANDTKMLMIIDDGGLLKPNHHFGLYILGFKGTPFSGKAIITMETREGDFKSLSPIWEDAFKKLVFFMGDDSGLESFIVTGLVDRPETRIGALGPDMKPSGPSEKIWEWEPNQ